MKYFLYILFILPAVLQAQVDSCKMYFNKADYTHARTCLELTSSLIKLSDTIPYLEYHYMLGVSLLSTGAAANGVTALQNVNTSAAAHAAVKKYAYWEYVSAIQLGNYTYQTKDYSRAETYYTRVLSLYPQVNDNTYKSDYIVLSNNLANIYYQSGQHAKAVTHYQKVLELKKKMYGEQHTELVKTYNQLALCQRSAGNCAEALSYYALSEKVLQALGTIESKEMADVRTGQGICLYQQSDFTAAYPAFQTALDLSVKNQQRQNALTALYYLSSLSLKNTETEKARQYIQQGLQQLNGNTTDEFFPYFCSRNADYLISTGRYAEAETAVANGLMYYQSIAKNEVYWKLQASKADVYRKTGRLDDAGLLYLDIEKQIASDASMSAVYASVLNNHALLYDEKGDYTNAEACYLKDIELSKKMYGEQSLSCATSLMNLSDLYKETGNYEKAEKLNGEASQIIKNSKGEQSIEYAQVLNNAASLQQLLGRSAEAGTSYKKVLNIYESKGMTQSLAYAFALSNYAGYQELTGQYKEALQTYQRCMPVIEAQAGKSNPAYGAVLNNMSLLSIKATDYALAEQYLKQDLDIVKTTYGEQHPSYATAMSNLAEVYEAQNKLPEAEELYTKALAIRMQSFGEKHPDIAPLYANLARIQQCKKDFVQAKQYWKKALDLYQEYIQIYFPSMSEKEKKQFYDGIRTRIEQFYSFAEEHTATDPELAAWVYNLQINTKALLFNSTNRVRDLILSSNNKELIQKYASWKNQKEQLSKLYTLTGGQVANRQKKIDSLLLQVNTLEKELSQSSAVFKKSITTGSTWKDIQARLAPTDAVVEIIRYTPFKPQKGGYYTDSIHYMYVVLMAGIASPKTVIVKNGMQLEHKYYSFYQNATQFEIADGNSYTQYWLSLKTLLTGKTTVYVSPDGIYNKINLYTLYDKQSNNYLIDQIDLMYITNSAEIKNIYPAAAVSKIALFGAPDFTAFNGDAVVLPSLPGTLTEINTLSALLTKASWKVISYSGLTANEINLKHSEGYRIIHIASHGFFDADRDTLSADHDPLYSFNENPLFKSGFYLSPAVTAKRKLFKKSYITNTEDGIVTAYELMNMNLNGVELVVLSACETGLGLVQNGEGVYGLQRAIRAAGAQSVLFSLWKVNDQATQELMTEFYAQYLLTGNKRTALKNAQLTIRKKYPNPYYWGAFILNGE